jgi:hypothetical protein
MSLLNQVSLLEIYTYIGLLSGWWFSSQHLAPALKKNKVEDKKNTLGCRNYVLNSLAINHMEK